MAKDKKKKKSSKKGQTELATATGKKVKAEATTGTAKKCKAEAAHTSKKSKASKLGKRLKEATESPLVAEVIAAALVATAAALRDSNKARQLASDAGDELGELAKDGADRGQALWRLALEVGRRAIAELGADQPGRAAGGKK